MNPIDSPWHLQESSTSFLLAEEAAYWLLGKQGQDVVVIDLRGKSDVCDFFVIATGQADVHVKALVRAVRDGLGRSGRSLLHVEGLDEANWALMDFVDVVVHIFRNETRQYYLLENLWGDAPLAKIEPEHFQNPIVAARHADLSGAGAGEGEQEADRG
jgi:ribosome-associated protein